MAFIIARVMKNPFSIDKSFTIRHKILEYLNDDWKKHRNEENRVVGSLAIAEATLIHTNDIHDYQNLLVTEGELIVSDNNGQIMMSITPNGKSAFVDQKYIKEGRKSKWDNIYSWARIVIPAIALAWSIINSFYSARLQSEITELKIKIQHPKK